MSSTKQFPVIWMPEGLDSSTSAGETIVAMILDAAWRLGLDSCEPAKSLEILEVLDEVANDTM